MRVSADRGEVHRGVPDVPFDDRRGDAYTVLGEPYHLAEAATLPVRNSRLFEDPLRETDLYDPRNGGCTRAQEGCEDLVRRLLPLGGVPRRDPKRPKNIHKDLQVPPRPLTFHEGATGPLPVEGVLQGRRAGIWNRHFQILKARRALKALGYKSGLLMPAASDDPNEAMGLRTSEKPRRKGGRPPLPPDTGPKVYHHQIVEGRSVSETARLLGAGRSSVLRYYWLEMVKRGLPSWRAPAWIYRRQGTQPPHSDEGRAHSSECIFHGSPCWAREDLAGPDERVKDEHDPGEDKGAES